MGLQTRARTRATTGRHRRAAGLVLAAAVMITAACQSSVESTIPPPTAGNQGMVTSADAPEPGGTVVYGLGAETNGWNPSTNQWGSSGLQVARSIFDTMAAYDEQSVPRPFLLQSFEHNPDFTEWTLRLRPGITLHNGKTVTADTIVRNQQYLKRSPITQGAYQVIDHFQALDPATVRVTTTEPFAVLPLLLTSQLGVVADADWLESNDSTHPIGTGPFVFDSWNVGQKLVVKKNASYWRKDGRGGALPYLDSIEYRIITDTGSRASALRAGDIDLMQGTSAAQLTQFQADGGFQTYADPKSEIPETFIQLNNAKPPFDDVEARRALAYATNRDEVLEVMGGAAGESADGPFTKGSKWYEDAGYPGFDLEKAKQLVADVKARTGSFEMTLMIAPDPYVVARSQLLQQQWEAAGITVHIDALEIAQLIIKVVTGSYEATTWLQFDAPDPREDAVFWLPDPAGTGAQFTLNFARMQDEVLTDAIHRADATDDPAVIKQQIDRIQERFADQVPYVWLYHQPVYIVANKRLVNLVDWTLPDGTPGLDLYRGSSPMAQVWIRKG